MSALRLAGFVLGLGAIAAAILGLVVGLPRAGAAGLAALAALALAADGVVMGRVWSRGSDVERLDAPIAFWVTCTSYAGLAVLMAAVAIHGG